MRTSCMRFGVLVPGPVMATFGEEAMPMAGSLKNRQLALGGLRFFSTSASVIIIIIGSTGHS